jgi:transposase
MPRRKGKVEALVKFVKANLPPDGFTSLAEANRWAEQWCAEVNWPGTRGDAGSAS